MVLEHSSKEFFSLLKTSAARFPAHLRQPALVARKSSPEAEVLNSRQLNPLSSQENFLAQPARPSIDIEDKLSGIKLAAHTTPSLSDPLPPNLGIQSRSEPTIQTESFPRKCSRKYTLVLDLDETLIHFKNDVNKPKFLIRPYAYCFLRNLSTNFEIIIFTAAQKEYADWILDKIDSKNNIVYRLYREHCQMSKTSHIKDLRLLGRDLSKTIIVDNFAENFALHRENGICIKSWYGDMTDEALVGLEKVLLQLATANVDDVRPFMKQHIESDPEKGVLVFH